MSSRPWLLAVCVVDVRTSPSSSVRAFSPAVFLAGSDRDRMPGITIRNAGACATANRRCCGISPRFSTYAASPSSSRASRPECVPTAADGHRAGLRGAACSIIKIGVCVSGARALSSVHAAQDDDEFELPAAQLAAWTYSGVDGHA